MSRSLICFILVISPAVAFADSADFAAMPIGSIDLPFEPQVHVNGGFELLGGDATSEAFRAHALFGGRMRNAPLVPSLSLGATFSAGGLHVDSMFADRTLAVGMTTIGPELLSDIDIQGVRIYGSVAAVRASLAGDAPIADRPDVASGWGMRAGVGINFAHAEWQYVRSESRSSESGAPLLLIAPQQFEVTFERDAGTTRAGFCVSWGV